MTQQFIDLLLWYGVLGVPAALLFGVFISTLGPEKPADKEIPR